jgi:purine-cytosine permease-like protein
MSTVLFLSIISSLISIFIASIINVFGISYGNKKIFSKTKRGLRYLITCFILIGCNLGLLVLFNSFMNNYILIRILTNLILLILLGLSNYFIIKKSNLYEEWGKWSYTLLEIQP